MTITGARLEARLPSDTHALLKRAAEIQGRTLTDFVVAAASEAAARVVADLQLVHLSVDDQRRFAAALLDPPPPESPAMRRARERRRVLFGEA